MNPPPTALILAGGVAKGAFEAGALEVLTSAGVSFQRIVAASSGALNGTLMAAAVRAGRAVEAAELLVQLWDTQASWRHVIKLAPREAIEGRALSSSTHILKLLDENVGRFLGGARHPVVLRMVVAPINGVLDTAGPPATTFEQVITFDEAGFDSDERRRAIYQTAAASAAFPGLFAPVELPGLGPCYDGGVVNDAPVRLAVEAGAARIFVVAPYPMEVQAVGPLTLARLVPRLADALIHERLFRDLRDAERVNRILAELERLVAAGALSPAQRDAVGDLLGWRRRVEIVQIRPAADLPGNAFSGFFQRSLRRQYLDAGREAARQALAVNG